MLELQNRVALVTGASSGIGRAIAMVLGCAGARVVMTARNASKLADACAGVSTTGGMAAPLIADLSNPNVVDHLGRRASQAFGPIEILVNAASVNFRQSVDDIDHQCWDQTLNLNLSLPFFLARSLVRDMRRAGRGKIINIASPRTPRMFSDNLAHDFSKLAVEQLTRAMSEAWSGFGISCNAIAEDFYLSGIDQEEFHVTGIANQVAHPKDTDPGGTLYEFREAVMFLASPASDFLTGKTFFAGEVFCANCQSSDD